MSLGDAGTELLVLNACRESCSVGAAKGAVRCAAVCAKAFFKLCEMN